MQGRPDTGDLKVPEAAHAAGVGASTFWRWIREGRDSRDERWR